MHQPYRLQNEETTFDRFPMSKPKSMMRKSNGAFNQLRPVCTSMIFRPQCWRRNLKKQCLRQSILDLITIHPFSPYADPGKSIILDHAGEGITEKPIIPIFTSNSLLRMWQESLSNEAYDSSLPSSGDRFQGQSTKAALPAKAFSKL